MFISCPILILILLFTMVILCVVLYQWKKNTALKSLCRLSLSQRLLKLNDLLFPLGLHYDDAQDTFFLLPASREVPDLLKNNQYQDYFFYHGGRTIRIRLMAVCDSFLTAAQAELSFYHAVIPFDACDLFPMEPLPSDLLPYMELTFGEANHSYFSFSGKLWRVGGLQIHPQAAPATLNVELTFSNESVKDSLAHIPGITFTGQTAHLQIEMKSLPTTESKIKAFAYFFITGPAFRTADRLLLLHGMRPQN